MSFRFDLGPRAPCSLEVLTDTRLLVQANSGGGKSWLLRRILEQTHGRIQQLVIDPEGEFSTLRETGDYVLAARQHGDTVADPRSAKLMAERLLELGDEEGGEAHRATIGLPPCCPSNVPRRSSVSA